MDPVEGRPGSKTNSSATLWAWSPRRADMGTQDAGCSNDYRAIFATYAERTTAHGISRVYSSRALRRVVWSALVTFSMTFVVYQIVTLILKYTSFAVETELRVSYNRHMNFPAVTICNLNALRLSKVIDPRHLPRDLLTSVPEVRAGVVNILRERPWLVNYTGLGEANLTDPYLIQLRQEIMAPLTASDEETPNVTYSNEVVQILDALGIPIDQVQPGRLRQALIAVLLAYVDQGIVARVGHQARALIRTCAFNGVRCNYTDFSEFQSDSFGNCFTYNSGRNDSAILSMGYSGPMHALRLELNVEQYDYITFLQETAGARIVIHDQGIRPFPQEEGITVAPGYHTSIGINRNGITRLTEPHGKCTHGTSLDTLPGYKYSVMACLKICIQRAVISACGCRIPLLPSAEDHYPVCSFSLRREDYFCMLKVAADNPSLAESCTCPESCNELSFNPLLSFGDWPNAATDKKELADIRSTGDLLSYIPEGNVLTDIRSNMLRLDLYYQELNDIQIVQRESYTLLSLVSDIGGQMGLWIGMSVLSLCEGFELLFDLLNAVFMGSAQRMVAKADIKPRE